MNNKITATDLFLAILAVMLIGVSFYQTWLGLQQIFGGSSFVIALVLSLILLFLLWQIRKAKVNGTYLFSYGLGTVICIIGLFVLLGIWFPKLGMIGGLLTFGMSLVTLSFLITTPEVYVPNLGGDFPTPQFGFPYLSGAGRLVLKDIIMLAGGLIIASDSARKLIKNNS